MNKTEIIEALATQTDISKAKAGEVLDALLNLITKSLKKKEEVKFIGFGTFGVSKRKATKGRNPRTGEEIKIAASLQAKFKPGKALKDTINGK